MKETYFFIPNFGFNLLKIHNGIVFEGHKKGSAKSSKNGEVASTLLEPSLFCGFASPAYSRFSKVSGYGPNALFDLTSEEYGNAQGHSLHPVSYTHLTLPTIYSV